MRETLRERNKGPYSDLRGPGETLAQQVAHAVRQRRLEEQARLAPTGRDEEAILRRAQCPLAPETKDIANTTEQGIVLPPIVW